jgi:manganese transport protein
MLSGFIPGFDGSESLLLAVGIVGATVMPHAIYAHSALCRDRFNLPEYVDAKRAIVRATKIDVSLAMGLAGAINIAIFLVGAINLYGKNIDDSIIGAHSAITTTLGAGIGTLFAVGLLASGVASSSVGTYASGVISQGLLKFRIPAITQRLIALAPALVVIAIADNATMALVLSQVILSLGIPFALFPLVYMTSKSEIMGNMANGRAMKYLGYAIALLLTLLNATMLFLIAN